MAGKSWPDDAIASKRRTPQNTVITDVNHGVYRYDKYKSKLIDVKIFTWTCMRGQTCGLVTVHDGSRY